MASMKWVVGVFKRMTGSSSTYSQASTSSPHSSEPTSSPTSINYEEEQKEQAEPQVEAMEMDASDGPYLDLQGDQEKQAYTILMDRAFGHTKVYDPELLEKIGMNIDFACVWSAIGPRCAISLDKTCHGFSRHGFWGEISSQIVHDKFVPRCNEIQNPTVRLMHKWLAIALFPREDIPLPNPGLCLYNCRSLTMPLEPQVEARRSNVSCRRMTRSMLRMPVGWAPTGYMTGVTPGYAPSWDQPSYQHGVSSSAWQSASSDEWA
uniref:Uncharacterized protein n=1 Tax=Setaria italica TaxID=4555 RepID=K4AKP5_SETIT